MLMRLDKRLRESWQWPTLAVLATLAGGAVTMAQSSPSTAEERIWHGNFSRAAGPPASFKLLDWNIERGLQMQGITDAIRRESPHICLLQEVDLNARRTHRQNIAEDLARKLVLNYVFAVEFEELSQGSQTSPAYHGQAIFAPFPIRAPRVIRFAHQSDFWRPRRHLPKWPVFQPRLGGRMALVAEIDVGGTALVVYNTHLESRGADRLRLLQLEEILADANHYSSMTPIVLAGDLNTKSASSRVISRLKQSGFRDAVGQEVVSTKLGGGSKDWIFVRGPLWFGSGKVHQDIVASDHYPISVQLSLTETPVSEIR